MFLSKQQTPLKIFQNCEAIRTVIRMSFQCKDSALPQLEQHYLDKIASWLSYDFFYKSVKIIHIVLRKILLKE